MEEKMTDITELEKPIPNNIQRDVIDLMNKHKLLKSHKDKKIGRDICRLIMKYQT